jgi:myo-inositol 2-dehydrogenase/D-chiro-inositol 1-dehydrogenase
MSGFNLGLVGGGRMGQMHLRALSSSNQLAVTSVVEPFEATAEKLKGMGYKVFPNLEQMTISEKLDGILVATPTDRHLQDITEIANTGISILSEKPCGLTSDQARQAGEICSKNDIKLQVAYWRRFIPELKEIARKIASGEIGEVHFINAAQWDESPPRKEFRLASGGIFVDMAVHEIDQIRWLTGQEVIRTKTSIFPQTEDSKGDTDSTQSILEMSGGAIGLVSLGRFHPGGDLVSAEIFTSKEHARIDILNPGTGEKPQLDALRLQAESFANWVQGGAREGATSADAEAALDIANQLKANVGLISTGGK